MDENTHASDTYFYANRSPLPISYYTKNYNNDRRARAIVIDCCMKKYEPFLKLPKSMQEMYVRKIERGCYNATCAEADRKNTPRNWGNRYFKDIYNMVTYRVQQNLKYRKEDVGSEYLIDRILKNQIDPYHIATMKSHELRPAKTKDIYDTIEKRKQQRVVKKYSTQHECRKCGGRKTTEIELQIRSLDEGSTVIITCEMENCSNVWSITS